MTSFDVRYYRVRLGAWKEQPGSVPITGLLECMDDSADWQHSLTIYFVQEGQPCPHPQCDSSGRRAWTYVPASQIATYLSLLNGEKAVTALIDDSPTHEHYLTAGPKSVGGGANL